MRIYIYIYIHYLFIYVLKIYRNLLWYCQFVMWIMKLFKFWMTSIWTSLYEWHLVFSMDKCNLSMDDHVWQSWMDFIHPHSSISIYICNTYMGNYTWFVCTLFFIPYNIESWSRFSNKFLGFKFKVTKDDKSTIVKFPCA